MPSRRSHFQRHVHLDPDCKAYLQAAMRRPNRSVEHEPGRNWQLYSHRSSRTLLREYIATDLRYSNGFCHFISPRYNYIHHAALLPRRRTWRSIELWLPRPRCQYVCGWCRTETMASEDRDNNSSYQSDNCNCGHLSSRERTIRSGLYRCRTSGGQRRREH